MTKAPRPEAGRLRRMDARGWSGQRLRFRRRASSPPRAKSESVAGSGIIDSPLRIPASPEMPVSVLSMVGLKLPISVLAPVLMFTE